MPFVDDITKIVFHIHIYIYIYIICMKLKISYKMLVEEVVEIVRSGLIWSYSNQRRNKLQMRGCELRGGECGD